MSLSAFALRNRTIVSTMVVLLMLWGVLSYLTMSRREDPEYTVRTCLVLTNWPGTPTEKVEELITAPLAATPPQETPPAIDPRGLVPRRRRLSSVRDYQCLQRQV